LTHRIFSSFQWFPGSVFSSGRNPLYLLGQATVLQSKGALLADFKTSRVSVVTNIERARPSRQLPRLQSFWAYLSNLGSAPTLKQPCSFTPNGSRVFQSHLPVFQLDKQGKCILYPLCHRVPDRFTQTTQPRCGNMFPLKLQPPARATPTRSRPQYPSWSFFALSPTQSQPQCRSQSSG
jgi:hypothetical protein